MKHERKIKFQERYRTLSELTEYFPKNSVHKAFKKINLEMDKALDELLKLKDENH